jgi:hypothetical protein
MWQYIQDRSGWSVTAHSTKIWIVWFLMLVITGAFIELIIKADLNWAYLIAIAIVSRFAARFIVGPEKKNEEE